MPDTPPKPRPVPIDALVVPLKRTFSEHALVGGGLLLAATVAALVWANSPGAAAYHALWNAEVTIGTEALHLEKSLLHWVNDALMALFFFHVGLEIKYEVIAGELSSLRRLLLPLIAALGGMVVPSLLYTAVNVGGPLADGWGMTMATDIAFALGLFAVLGDRVPGGLKVFLTALAIVDDIGSILVIAVFYSEGVAVWLLGVAALLLLASFGLNRLGVRSSVAYGVVGALVWLCFLKSGVHATLAAVLMAMTIPARTRLDADAFGARLRHILERWRKAPDPAPRLLSREQQQLVDAMADAVEKGTAPLQRFMEGLAPVVSFVVLPVFALANAGVSLSGAQLSAVPATLWAGVALGLVVGKPVGIVGAAWLATKLGLADLPDGVRPVHLIGTGLVAGVGFTMSLFIAGLAFADPVVQQGSRLAVLGSSAVAGVAGCLVLWRAAPAEPPTPEA